MFRWHNDTGGVGRAVPWTYPPKMELLRCWYKPPGATTYVLCRGTDCVGIVWRGADERWLTGICISERPAGSFASAREARRSVWERVMTQLISSATAALAAKAR